MPNCLSELFKNPPPSLVNPEKNCNVFLWRQGLKNIASKQPMSLPSTALPPAWLLAQHPSPCLDLPVAPQLEKCLAGALA